MFNIPYDIPASNDDYSKEVIASINNQMSQMGMIEEYTGPDMIGRCYPARLGEDVQMTVDGVISDMLSYLEFNGWNHYQVHHVKKADNGYIVTYSVG